MDNNEFVNYFWNRDRLLYQDSEDRVPDLSILVQESNICFQAYSCTPPLSQIVILLSPAFLLVCFVLFLCCWFLKSMNVMSSRSLFPYPKAHHVLCFAFSPMFPWIIIQSLRYIFVFIVFTLFSSSPIFFCWSLINLSDFPSSSRIFFSFTSVVSSIRYQFLSGDESKRGNS